MGQVPEFSYSADLIRSIERTVTRERLRRYLAASRQDMTGALKLYEINVSLSESLHGFMQGLEVAFRNAAHLELSRLFNTSNWFDLAPLTNYHRDKLAEAKRKGGGRPGKVVAELTFGFWTDLIAQPYHLKLWMPSLRNAFRNTTLHRPVIHKRLEQIRWLRNRMAHYEPILTSRNQIYVGHQQHISPWEMLEVVQWLCADTAKWLAAQSRYAESVLILARVNALGIQL